MIQIALLIFAGVLIFRGIKALTGSDPDTTTATAVTSIVMGALLGGFAFLMPLLLGLFMGR